MPHLLYIQGITGYTLAENARRLEMIRRLVHPGFTIDLVIPPDGPAVLEEPSHFDQMHRAILSTVRNVHPDRCGAIIMAGAVDPGLAELRAAAKVPVIGPGEASLYLSRLLGSRLAILVVKPAIAGARAMIDAVPAKPDVVMIRAMDITVRGILANPAEGRRIMRDAAVGAVREDRADVLYLGSMTQGTLGVVQELQKELGVPVLDPLPISIYTAEQAALAREAG